MVRWLVRWVGKYLVDSFIGEWTNDDEIIGLIINNQLESKVGHKHRNKGTPLFTLNSCK